MDENILQMYVYDVMREILKLSNGYAPVKKANAIWGIGIRANVW